MQGEFILPDDARWSKLLDSVVHDVYHLPEYAAHSSKHFGGAAAAFFAESDEATFLLPILIRSLGTNFGTSAAACDLHSPYGYPAPLVAAVGSNKVIDLSMWKRFFDEMQRVAALRGAVSAFIRFHPLLPRPADDLGGSVRLSNCSPVVYLDLTRPTEELRLQVRKGYRYDVRKLEREGFDFVMDDWDRLDEFGGVYEASMERLSAGDVYRFSRSYFHDLRAMLGRHVHLCCAVAPSGDLAAGAVFTHVRGMVQYHLAATAEKYRAAGPSKLIISSMIDWAVERGAEVLHLGGGLGGRRDSLFQFKAGWSDARSEFCTASMIIDPSEYWRLTKERCARCAQDGDDDYFPAYRRVCTHLPDFPSTQAE